MMKCIASLLLFVVSVFSLDSMEELLRIETKRPPSENLTSPLSVKLGMYLESLGNFRSTEMSFDVDLYVYMSWKDARLAHNHSDHILVNDDKIRKQLWLPDLYFANARQAQFQEVTVPNFNLFIASDGTIAYSCRCTLTVACSLDLRFYPMDAQLCSIRVLSYAYVAKQVNVTWFEENPIRFNPEIGLPEFHINDVTKGYCNGTYRYALMPDSYKLDDFSCLTGNLYLARSIGYNLVQSYIPTGLIVKISWVSFWIDRRAVPARVTLSFTTLVSLTTLGNGLRFGLPQVSYAKAIDLWYGACMLFVFCALLEFAIINSYMRKAEKCESMSKKAAAAAAETTKPPTSSRRIPELNCRELPTSNGNGHASIKFIDDPTNDTKLNDDTWKCSDSKNSNQNEFTYESQPTAKLTSRSGDYDLVFMENSDDFEKQKNKNQQNGSPYDNVSTNTRRLIRTRGVIDSDLSDEDDFWRVQPYTPRVRYETGKEAADIVSQQKQAIHYATLSRQYSRHALFIDKSCRYAFPLSFLAFNIWYWWYYLVYQRVDYMLDTL